MKLTYFTKENGESKFQGKFSGFPHPLFFIVTRINGQWVRFHRNDVGEVPTSKTTRKDA